METAKQGAQTATEGAKRAGSTVGAVAKRATVPAIAAGAGIAGLAGGLALAHRGSRKRLLGMPMPTGTGTRKVSKNLYDASKNVGRFGEGMGSLAAEIRTVREGLGQPGNSKRSPLEVVLEGLTRRR